jgi:hypothetical protein
MPEKGPNPRYHAITSDHAAQIVRDSDPTTPHIIFGDQVAVRSALEATGLQITQISGAEFASVRTTPFSPTELRGIVLIDDVASLSEDDLYSAFYHLKTIRGLLTAPVALSVPVDYTLWGTSAAKITNFLNFLIVED